jgi:hypothetical protein
MGREEDEEERRRDDERQKGGGGGGMSGYKWLGGPDRTTQGREAEKDLQPVKGCLDGGGGVNGRWGALHGAVATGRYSQQM